MSSIGHIYIFSNNEFKSDVYKIGKARNVFKRMSAFTTAYVEPLKIEFISDKCNNYSVVEREVHIRLKRYRIKTNREFFNICLETAVKVIENVIEELNALPEIELTNYHDTNYKPDIELFYDAKVIISSDSVDEVSEFHPVEQFLINLCEYYPMKTKIDISDKIFYSKFQTFLIDNNIEFETTPLKLGVKLANLKTGAISKRIHTSIGAYAKNYNLEKLRTLYELNDVLEL